MEDCCNTGRSVKFDEFVERIGLNQQETEQRRLARAGSPMPFRVTEHFTRVIEQQEDLRSKEQLVNIVLPLLYEKSFEGRTDPYGNVASRQGVPFLQHKYEPTLLLHFDDACIANCQFCYKVDQIRREKVARESSVDEKLEAVITYIKDHPEIDNVLLTGGDPAFRKTSDLVRIIGTLAEQERVRAVRFATKGLAFNPSRFQDEELLASFREINTKLRKRVVVIAQYNHPAEIDEHSRAALTSLQEAGVQVYGQPVILRGVNDDASVLVELQNKFFDNKIQSYYLIACMPVKGSEQYSIPLEVTYRLVEESKSKLNGLAKKGVVIAPHNFGKLEICGFLPSPDNPRQVVIKWHEIAMPQYLPSDFKEDRTGTLRVLDFKPDSLYCADHVFNHNGLPHLNNEDTIGG